MKKNRWVLRALALLSITAVLSMTVSLAAEPGTDKDPLVTLSYLNETFMDSILQKVGPEQPDCPAAGWTGRGHCLRYGGVLYRGHADKGSDPHGRHRLRGHAAGGHCHLRVALQSWSH